MPPAYLIALPLDTFLYLVEIRLTFRVGTPNVQGFAYLLIQHKQQLENMFISKLQVFHGETAHENPCIIMHISQQSTQTDEVERRDVGKNIVRVRTVRAML